MRSVVLFIAMSLDGYIADDRGGVEWLAGQDPAAETADSCSAFLQFVDTVIMGWNTYRQITEELSPERWVYEGLQTYVLTHRNLPPAPGIIFLADEAPALTERLRAQPGKDIWICGGADIIRPLIADGCIDIYRISIIPTILGRGIRLFNHLNCSVPLRLTSVSTSNGIAELTYLRR